jgi:hypothetical protein
MLCVLMHPTVHSNALYTPSSALITAIMHYTTGLWNAWFLKMFRGDKLPTAPQKPSTVHQRDGVEVPYTAEEQTKRTATYTVKMATWDKTMKVIIVLACQTQAFQYDITRI